MISLDCLSIFVPFPDLPTLRECSVASIDNVAPFIPGFGYSLEYVDGAGMKVKDREGEEDLTIASLVDPALPPQVRPTNGKGCRRHPEDHL